MNKKGFTLVELLAVITILAILATIAGVTFVGVKNSYKEKECYQKIEMLEIKFLQYWEKERIDTDSKNNKQTITIGSKYFNYNTYGLEEEEIENPLDGQRFKGIITMSYNSSGFLEAKYQYIKDGKIIDECEQKD